MAILGRQSWAVSARPSKITVPERANPLAKLVFFEMGRQRVTYSELEHRANVLVSTFKAWRKEKNPGLTSIEAALGSLGWALVPVPCLDRVPAWVKDALEDINARWSTEEPLLHRLLASACLAPILVDRADSPPVTIDVVPTAVRTRRKKSGPNPYQTALFLENSK